MRKAHSRSDSLSRILAASGLAVVGAMLGKSNFVKNYNKISVSKKRSQPQIKNGDILLTQIGFKKDSASRIQDNTHSW